MAKRKTKATKRKTKRTMKAAHRKTKVARAANAPKSARSASTDPSASQRIDARIAELDDWRGERLAQVRRLVHAALPNVVEEWKWRVPVWSCGGIVCTGEVYREIVKITFARGAALADPTGLFNASLTGNIRRAIDLRSGDALDESAFTALVRAAAALAARGSSASDTAPTRRVRAN